MADFDLLLRGGTVIDPSAALVDQRDVHWYPKHVIAHLNNSCIATLNIFS